MKNKKISVALYIVVIIITNVSSSIYLPSLPMLGRYFNVENSQVQLTLSLYLIGQAISGIIYGPLSDHYGRRPIILIGTLIFTFASIANCFASSIVLLIITRFIQGLGSGAAVVVSYASIKDLFLLKNERAKIISQMNMIVALVPTVSPIVGGMIIFYIYSWHILFIVVAFAAVIVLGLLYFACRETINSKPDNAFSVLEVFYSYNNLLRNRQFLRLVLINSLVFTWLWSYSSTLPFILIGELNVREAYYGYFILIGTAAYIIGNIINQFSVVRFGIVNMIKLGLFLSLLGDAIVMIIYHYGIPLNAVLLQLIISPCYLGVAMILGNNLSYTLETLGRKTGAGTAFTVFSQMIFGSIGVYVAGYVYDGTIFPTVYINILMCLSIIYVYIIRGYKDNTEEVISTN